MTVPSEAGLLEFCHSWDLAMKGNDPDAISAFMSDDWTIVGTHGGIVSKVDFMKSISSGEVRHTIMNSDLVQVRIYGNTGIIIARGISAGVYREQPFELYEWSMSVCIIVDGKWQCVSTMVTDALPQS